MSPLPLLAKLEAEQFKPYSHRRCGRSWFWREVMFEDTPVREVGVFAADDLVFLLNAAYRLGFSSGFIVGELQQMRRAP